MRIERCNVMTEQQVPKSIPWLISLIERLRPDLCKKFQININGERVGFGSWLVTSGIKEYQALLEDDAFLEYLHVVDAKSGLTILQQFVYEARPDVEIAYPLTEGRAQFLGWFERHGIEEHQLWPMLPLHERLRLQMAAPWLSHYDEHDQKSVVTEYFDRPFGVNLIGYVFGQLGIGEDLRMAAHAMFTAGIPFT